MALLDSTLLYHGSTSLYLTLPYSTMAKLLRLKGLLKGYETHYIVQLQFQLNCMNLTIDLNGTHIIYWKGNVFLNF